MEQMAFILKVDESFMGGHSYSSNLGELNELLKEWRIVNCRKMGTAGGGKSYTFVSYSLVVLEK